jgi:acetylornithine deacetylase/succinyl-diaminopimelate desuccinylase-like protein
MFSPGGHDIMNVSDVGIPSAMLVVPSRSRKDLGLAFDPNSGMGHNPDEYSTPEDLEKGAQVLYASVLELVNQ